MTDPMPGLVTQVDRLGADLDARHAAEHVGHALDERVRVTAHGGRLVAVELDPQVLRLTNAEVADAFVEAANAALAGGDGAEAVAGTGLGALVSSLRETQQLSQEWLDQAAEGMRRSVAQVQEVSELHLGVLTGS